jgi:GNAT superfamily N-acetyltransferase
MEIVVKPLSLENLDEVKQVAESVMQSDFVYYSPEVKRKVLKEDLDIHTRLVATETFMTFGAFVEEKLIGFLSGLTPIGGIVNILWLMVQKDFQGKGVGSKLLEDNFNWAKEHGAHAIHLFSPKQNKEFYEKLGFETVGLVRRSYYDHDDYFMIKIINP